MDAVSAYLKAIEAMLKQSDLLAKMVEASLTGDGVMIRIVDDELVVEQLSCVGQSVGQASTANLKSAEF